MKRKGVWDEGFGGWSSSPCTVFGLWCYSLRAVAATAFRLWLLRSSDRGYHSVWTMVLQPSGCGCDLIMATAVFGLGLRLLASCWHGLWTVALRGARALVRV